MYFFAEFFCSLLNYEVLGIVTLGCKEKVKSQHPIFQSSLADLVYFMCLEQHMYTDQLLRPPGAVLIGLKIEIFDMFAYLMHDLYHETYSSSDHII